MRITETRADAAGEGAPPRGLSQAEAERRLAEVGPNQLPEPRPDGPLLVFARQFLSPFIGILIVAGVISLAIDQVPSAVFIAAVLLLNAAIGAVQEMSAQRAASALRKLVKGVAHVLRDGAPVRVDITALVPGDVILVASGDRVPADAAVIACSDLEVDESMLTGESLAVRKAADAATAPDAPASERSDMLFAGTIVTRGRARAVVTATGLSTQIGAIASRIAARREAEPPLMIRIRAFTYQVATAIFVAILALIALMALRGGYALIDMVMMGVGLAVSAIPEGLPAALTVALAIGMRRMSKENVIIRKLVAVEALGSCTFICSDKTGTLTVNELTIAKAVLPCGREYSASGAGVAPGEIDGEDRARLSELVAAGVLANESHLDYAGASWAADGDIVDVAFLVFAKKFGVSLQDLRAARPQARLIPYESERAFSASLNARDGAQVLSVKGSPEKILAACATMRVNGADGPIDAAAIEAQFSALAASGYRVIALAERAGADLTEPEAALEGLAFLGMVAMIDPIRPEARRAVAQCRDGGIGVAMVTGDHPATARAIGVDLGLCGPGDPVVTGADIRAAAAQGEAALAALILPTRIFARIEPTQKETIVRTFGQAGHFVAVTGDGVNDAPAMRRANTGVAMGKAGADVAKEAADLIITDDNFASIVAGIEQGRIVYNNIRKVIALLSATGFSAILLFFLAVAFGLPMPLTAVQLLWLNLVANGMQDVALAFEPKEGDELARPPRDPKEPIFEKRVIEHVAIAGATMGVLAFSVFAWSLSSGAALAQAQNLTLLTMVLFGNVHALSSRSETRSLIATPYFSNPFLAIATPAALGVHVLAMHTPGLSSVLGLAPVGIDAVALVVGAALAFLAVEEAHKAAQRRTMFMSARQNRESQTNERTT